MGTSLVVQWLRLHAANAGGTGSIPGGGTKIPHAAWCGQKVKKKKKVGRDLENKFMAAGQGQGRGGRIESLGWTCTHCYI